MINELACVWTALFSESPNFSACYNEKLLNSAIETELSQYSNGHENYKGKGDEYRLYSIKKALQLALEHRDPVLGELPAETIFKFRQELVSTFLEVAHEEEFDRMIQNALKLAITDSLNRIIRGSGGDLPTAPVGDVSNVAAVDAFLGIIAEIKGLVAQIQNTKEAIADAEQETARLKKLEHQIDEYSQRLNAISESSATTPDENGN